MIIKLKRFEPSTWQDQKTFKTWLISDHNLIATEFHQTTTLIIKNNQKNIQIIRLNHLPTAICINVAIICVVEENKDGIKNNMKITVS